MSEEEINPELLPITISANTLTPSPNASRFDLLYSTIEATIQDVQARSEIDRPDLIVITDITTQEGEHLWDILEENFESRGIRKTLDTRNRTLKIKLWVYGRENGNIYIAFQRGVYCYRMKDWRSLF